MSRSFLIWMIVGACSTGAVLTVATVWKQHRTAEIPPARAVYVCRETGDLFVGQGQTAPQIHPGLGRATLWPAVYCPQCESWSASPPIERLTGHANLLTCPKCRAVRSFDGVIPHGATEL